MPVERDRGLFTLTISRLAFLLVHLRCADGVTAQGVRECFCNISEKYM